MHPFLRWHSSRDVKWLKCMLPLMHKEFKNRMSPETDGGTQVGKLHQESYTHSNLKTPFFFSSFPTPNLLHRGGNVLRRVFLFRIGNRIFLVIAWQMTHRFCVDVQGPRVCRCNSIEL